ncbi:MAG: SAM-dependent methyltransferase, partial [Anaerolineales bacterium]|nr:SAM-dependent methyltransferase [Anaerolineales bacterium]
MDHPTFISLLDKASASRTPLLDPPHETALRLFNGFLEGFPSLALDIYGSTLVIHDHADDPSQNRSLIEEAVAHVRTRLDWLHAGILK